MEMLVTQAADILLCSHFSGGFSSIFMTLRNSRVTVATVVLEDPFKDVKMQIISENPSDKSTITKSRFSRW